jgi:hypothetical protein
LGYTNPLWYANYEDIQEFVKIDNKISNFPSNFLIISKGDKKELSTILYEELKNVWKKSLELNEVPISLDLKNNSLDFASYNLLKSKVLISSYLGVLNSFHSKIFLEKTKVSELEYYKINNKILKERREDCINEINNFLE